MKAAISRRACHPLSQGITREKKHSQPAVFLPSHLQHVAELPAAQLSPPKTKCIIPIATHLCSSQDFQCPAVHLRTYMTFPPCQDFQCPSIRIQTRRKYSNTGSPPGGINKPSARRERTPPCKKEEYSRHPPAGRDTKPSNPNTHGKTHVPPCPSSLPWKSISKPSRNQHIVHTPPVEHQSMDAILLPSKASSRANPQPGSQPPKTTLSGPMPPNRKKKKRSSKQPQPQNSVSAPL